MLQISTGPSHSAAISVTKNLYTWGYKQGGRLGLTQEESKKAKREPVFVSYINELIQKNNQNLKEGRREEEGVA